jgi:tetratricopeptide (TPR) repeat protein
VATGLTSDQVRAALAAAESEDASPAERAEMLMEIAIGLQMRPKSPDEIRSAIALYDKALTICPSEMRLLRARILARKATALQVTPELGMDAFGQARGILEEMIPVLAELGVADEVAEAEMNLGLCIQNLAGVGRARISDAISAYQRALRTFTRTSHPKEFVILQNNLATAFLAMPMTDERGKMREALAVQAFEEGLKVVTLVDDPIEYAMLQNNLGNALQYASSSHSIENNLRAIEAYDEALKVRTREASPIAYANTISNKANCLWNLPDDPELPERGNGANLSLALVYYKEARELFAAYGDLERARIVGEAASQVEGELRALAGNGMSARMMSH